MKPSTILIAVVIFSTFVVASSLMMADLANKYSTPFDSSWNGTYNQVNSVATDMQSAQGAISASGASPTGFLDLISNGAYQTVKLTMNSGSLIKAMVEDAGNRYNIPPIFLASFIAIVTIVIVFGIASAVFRIPI